MTLHPTPVTPNRAARRAHLRAAHAARQGHPSPAALRAAVEAAAAAGRALARRNLRAEAKLADQRTVERSIAAGVWLCPDGVVEVPRATAFAPRGIQRAVR